MLAVVTLVIVIYDDGYGNENEDEDHVNSVLAVTASRCIIILHQKLALDPAC